MGDKVNVLLVDDEKIVGNRLKPALSKIGCEVEVYGDPKMALNRISEKEFDIVIANKEQVRNMAVNFIQIGDYKIVNIKSDLNEKLKKIGYDVIELELKELLKGNCGIRGIVLPFY